MAASQKSTSYEKKNRNTATKNTASKKGTSNRKSAEGTKKKTLADRKSTDTRKKDTFAENRTPYYNEMILGITLALSGLLLLSLFGLVPKWISWINDGVFGIIGVLGYIFPVALFVGVAFGIANQGNTFAKRKLISSIGLFWILTALLQLISTGYSKERNILDYFNICSKNRNGGGLLGGFLMSILCKCFGMIGAYLILGVITVLLIMFITDRFIFSSLGRNGAKQIKNLKEYQKNLREERRRYYQERDEFDAYEDGDYNAETYMSVKPLQQHEKAKVVTFPKNKKLEYTGELDTKAVNRRMKRKAAETIQSEKQTKQGELLPEEREAILRAQKRSRNHYYNQKSQIDAPAETIAKAESGFNQQVETKLDSKEEEKSFESGLSKKIPLYKEVLMNKFRKKNTVIEGKPSYVFSEEHTEENDGKEEMTATVDGINVSEQKSEIVESLPETLSQKTENIESTSETLSQETESFEDEKEGTVQDTTEVSDVQENVSEEVHTQKIEDTAKQVVDTAENSSEENRANTSEDAAENFQSDYTLEDKEVSPVQDEEKIVINRERRNEDSHINESDTNYNTSEYDPIENDEAIASPEENLEKLSAPVAKNTVSAQPATGQGKNMKEQSNLRNHPSSQNTAPVNSAENQTKIETFIEKEEKPYVYPTIDLLTKSDDDQQGMSDDEIREKAIKLKQTLDSFGVRVTLMDVSCGPSVTRFELQPEQGVKVSKITRLSDDIKLNLAAADIRIEAPIPGKAAVGIEVPNRINTIVRLRDLIDSKEFQSHKSNVAFAVGKDIAGKTVVTDVAKMPHLLIAGATGSGKSVCINTLIMSILYKADPKDVKLIMVDPKVVELSVYNGIPHLLIPVVTDPKKASAALNWAVTEMTDRYNKFAELGVREINGYNKKVEAVEDANDPRFQKMPQIVIIIDELADLMMVEPGEVEESICRLAQLARAAGIHLVIATQRPSVNVITGLIKANIPSRIAFAVSSAIDSRTILDGSGAEKLLGKGDMLFFPSGFPKPIRVQGAFVSDQEVTEVVEFLKQQTEMPQYNDVIAKQIENTKSSDSSGQSCKNDRDDYFIDAGKFMIEKDKASIGMLQRVFKIGYNRAARIMDQLSEAGVVGPEEGTKPRKVIMSLEQFEDYIDEYC